MKKIILSLFDYTGNWSQHFENDYEVIKIDIKNGIDILSWNYKKIKKENVKGILAAIPCTDYAVSGARWFKEGIKPYSLQEQGAEFFMEFVNADCEQIAIENPVGIMSTYYRKPNQIINPFQFGHPEQKKTCLWLKGLYNLKETNNVYDYMMTLPIKERTRIHWLGSNHSKERSKTFPGIAKAMAEQWGGDK